MEIKIFKVFLGFLIGAIFGSFINMFIYRISNNVSLKILRSFCPNCKKIIPWHENIPILSYILLKGKCSTCGYKIPKYYIFNELFLAILSAFLLYKAPNFYSYINTFLFFLCLHYMTVLDYFYMETDIRPAYFGSLYFLFHKIYFGKSINPLIEISLIVFFLFYLKEGFFILRGKEGLGEGDITVSAFITSFFGLKTFLYILILASISALFTFIYFHFRKREISKLPFLPFLYLGSLIIFFIYPQYFM